VVAAMTNAGDRTRARPVLDWLRAACVRLGPAGQYQVWSLVNQNVEATTPDARVVMCMQSKIAPFQLTTPNMPAMTSAGGGLAAPLFSGTLASQVGEREYSILETSKIQATCGLLDDW
jgi:hypothetical protein